MTGKSFEANQSKIYLKRSKNCLGGFFKVTWVKIDLHLLNKNTSACKTLKEQFFFFAVVRACLFSVAAHKMCNEKKTAING